LGAAAWARRRRQHGRVSGDDSGEGGDGARSDENNIQRFRVKAHRRRHDAIGEQKKLVFVIVSRRKAL
jgi:hypothetical protein